MRPRSTNDCGRSPRVLENSLRSFDQAIEFHRRMVRGGATRAMSEEILPVLDADPRRPQPQTECVLQVVYPQVGTGRTALRQLAPQTADATSSSVKVSISSGTWTIFRLPVLPLRVCGSRRSMANSSGRFQSASGAAR